MPAKTARVRESTTPPEAGQATTPTGQGMTKELARRYTEALPTAALHVLFSETMKGVAATLED